MHSQMHRTVVIRHLAQSVFDAGLDNLRPRLERCANQVARHGERELNDFARELAIQALEIGCERLHELVEGCDARSHLCERLAAADLSSLVLAGAVAFAARACSDLL